MESTCGFVPDAFGEAHQDLRSPYGRGILYHFSNLEQVGWFNHRRLSESVGTTSQANVEERYCAMMEQAARAADLAPLN